MRALVAAVSWSSVCWWSARIRAVSSAAPGLLGFAWADGDGVNRLATSATRELEACLRPSWSPRSPPEASNFLDDLLLKPKTGLLV
jgi:hypothetical protein